MGCERIRSVKSNIGHLDVAAGVAGLIKTVLALKYKKIPPSLHFETANPQIDFKNSPFYVSSELKEWPSTGGPRRAGVSSFGIGGTNAHVILEEVPKTVPSDESTFPQLLLLSAKTKPALEHATRNLAEYLKANPRLNLADVAYTLQCGRRDFDHRRMVVCENFQDAVASLEKLDANCVITSHLEVTHREVVFVFSGQGSQYPDMSRELYENEMFFREQIDYCSKIVQPQVAFDIRDFLFPNQDKLQEAAKSIEQTSIAQLAIFIVEYALAKLWISWGIRPAAVLGHSVGEYAAACIAGVFSVEDALQMVATRGRLMQQLPPGRMLAVSVGEDEASKLIGTSNLSLAAINSLGSCVISGDCTEIENLQDRLLQKKIDFQPLHTSHAFHSAMMDPILDGFLEQVQGVAFNPPQVPVVSTVTGTWIDAAELMTAAYWGKNLRHTVRFSASVETLLSKPERVFLEVGPGRALSTLVKQHKSGSVKPIALSSLRHPKEKRSDLMFITNSLGQLWMSGAGPDWKQFYSNKKRRRIPLPTYPFAGQRWYVDRTNYDSSILMRNRTVDLLLRGKTEMLVDELRENGQFSAAEGKLIPRLLEVLVEQCQATPPVPDRQARPTAGPAQFMPGPIDIQEQVKTRLLEVMEQPETRIYADLLVELEALSLEYVLAAFKESGWLPKPGERFSTDKIANQLKVVDEQRRLLARLLEMLEEEAVLSQSGLVWEVAKVPELSSPEERWSRLIKAYSSAEAELTLIRSFGSGWGRVLRGECNPLELLFPDGDLMVARRYYTDSPAMRGMNQCHGTKRSKSKP